MIDIKAIRELAENDEVPVVSVLCDEVERLTGLLGKANALCRIRAEEIKRFHATINAVTEVSK